MPCLISAYGTGIHRDPDLLPSPPQRDFAFIVPNRPIYRSLVSLFDDIVNYCKTGDQLPLLRVGERY